MALIRNLPSTDMQFGKECRVAETVSLIGSVKLDDGATVLSGAVIGSGSIIAAGTVVTENMIVPPGSMVMGVPGKVKRLVTRREQEEIPEYAKEYLIFAAEQLPLI